MKNPMTHMVMVAHRYTLHTISHAIEILMPLFLTYFDTIKDRTFENYNSNHYLKI